MGRCRRHDAPKAGPPQHGRDYPRFAASGRAPAVSCRLLTGIAGTGGPALATRTDPYHILVSEVMLQQTQVDRVLPKYHEWLASTRVSKPWPMRPRLTFRTWRPLGYNIRPKAARIAREAVEQYGGEFRADEETLLSFKGIGQYTAGAMM